MLISLTILHVLLQEFLSGPSDLMICFGTAHRLLNVSSSLNSKLLDKKKEIRKFSGINVKLVNLQLLFDV